MRAAHVGEGEARTEIRVPGIAREHRAGDAVHLGLDEAERSGSRCAQDPFDVSGHTENARAIGFVGQPKARYLYRSLDRHVLQEARGNAARCVFEAAVASPVPRDIGRLRVADGQRGRTPEIAGFVVSDVEGFARGVADRIVRPRGELVIAAIGGPGAAAAFGRRLETERRIGDHVDPRRRRRLAGPEHRHIFLAARAQIPPSR